MQSQFLTYDALNAEVKDTELDKDIVKDLFKTYADFFTLPMIDSRRFRSEVLMANREMKALSKAFDDLSQQAANYQVSAEVPGLPSAEYREDNVADQITTKYINGILGGFLDHNQIAGLAKGDTKPLLKFFSEYRVHWKFIIFYQQQLEAAAKHWYELHAKEILEENRRYLYQHKNEKHLLEKAAKFGLVFDNEEEVTRFLEFAKEKLSGLDIAQAHRTFKKAVKAKLNAVHKIFQWGKDIQKDRAAHSKNSVTGSAAYEEEEEEVIASGTIPSTVINNSTLFMTHSDKRKNPPEASVSSGKKHRTQAQP